MLIDGYSITQYPKENRIVITLPQRLDTPVSTILPVSERRMMLSDAEEAALLVAVKAMFENGRVDEVEDDYT